MKKKRLKSAFRLNKTNRESLSKLSVFQQVSPATIELNDRLNSANYLPSRQAIKTTNNCRDKPLHKQAYFTYLPYIPTQQSQTDPCGIVNSGTKFLTHTFNQSYFWFELTCKHNVSAHILHRIFSLHRFLGTTVQVHNSPSDCIVCDLKKRTQRITQR